MICIQAFEPESWGHTPALRTHTLSACPHTASAHRPIAKVNRAARRSRARRVRPQDASDSSRQGTDTSPLPGWNAKSYLGYFHHLAYNQSKQIHVESEFREVRHLW
jgi:hypothetical protein